MPKFARHKDAASRRWVIAASALLCAVVVGAPDVAHAQQLRFTDTKPGAILATGNALGLAKQPGANGPGTEDSIGTFICQNATVDDDPLNSGNPWPQYTTDDWTANGSSAVLELPADTLVLYAELVWGGSHYYWPEDVRANRDDPVTLSIAGGASTPVTPDASTALDIETTSSQGFAANNYIRSADVTAFVQQHGSGTYVTSGVPATQLESVDELNAAGWSLVVAYRDDTEPIRNLSIFVGGSWVDENDVQDYTVSGFCAPPFGAVEGHVVVSALEGDADREGDTLSLAPTVSDTFVRLAGPNNPQNNFFCSQINGSDGLVDTQGDFGTANHNATTAQNVSGGRQGWDVTTVEVTSQYGHLENDQTSAVIRTTTTGDSYVPALVALEIDVKSPDFTDGSYVQASMDVVAVGDSFTVTARLNNTGEALADNLVLVMPIDPGLALQSFTLDGNPGDVDGDPVTATTLESGVRVGQLDVNTALEVVLSLDVVDAPESGSTFDFEPTWHHGFQMCAGGPTLSDTYSPEPAEVEYDSGSGTGGAGATGGTGGSGGSGATGNFGGTGPGPGFNEDPTEEGGCGCATPGGASAPAGLLALLFGALSIGLRRRRR